MMVRTLLGGLMITFTLAACSAGGPPDEPVDVTDEGLTAEGCGENSILDNTPGQRQGMMRRGFDWVHHHVTYSQVPQSQWGGYRTDCSGFVSMSWGLPPPGETTSTFYQVEHAIGWDNLLPGDAIVRPGHHMVLFAGWTNQARTQFCAIEEYNYGHPATVFHHYKSSYSSYTPVRIDEMPKSKCWSERLDKDVIDGACIERPQTGWWQCVDGVWLEGKGKYGNCTALHAL
jgi:hypothetical protein